MTTYTDIELDRILDGFLGEGPASAPDQPIDAALEQIRGTHQRRSTSFLGGFRMSTPVRLVLVAALIVVAIAAGAAVIGSRPSEPTPIATPSPATASALPSAGPSTAVGSVAPASPVVALSNAALARVDAAIEGATTGGSPVSDAQTRLFRLTDAIREPLLGGSVASAVSAFDPLPAAAEEVAATLDPTSAEQLRTAVATLGGVLRASPFVPGELAQGTYHGTAFTPALAVAVPEGWTRGTEDREVLVLKKGDLTFAINKTATDATEAGLLKAIGRNDASGMDPAPASVTLPSYGGYAGGTHNGSGTLWFNEGSQAFDPKPTDDVRVWVLQAGSHVMTAELVGPPAEVDSALPAVESMLGSMVVAQQ